MANTFRHAHGRFSQYWNTEQKRTGHLWQNSAGAMLDMEWWQRRWTAEAWRGVLLERAESEQELRAIRRATYTGRPLGSKPFVAGLEKKLGRILEVRAGGRTKQNADRCTDQLEFGGRNKDGGAGTVSSVPLRSSRRHDAQLSPLPVAGSVGETQVLQQSAAESVAI